jgi:hypothetical protein
MPPTKVKAFRFTDEELELLEVIQGHTGIRSRTEALRAVLKYYVEGEGLTDVIDKKTPPKPAGR